MQDDFSTYPSRTFIRFAARNQLLADLTGQKMTVMVSRLGSKPYIQSIQPADQTDTANLGEVPPFELLDLECSVNITASDAASNPEDFSTAEPVPSPPIATGTSGLDEELLEEIATTAFHTSRHPELYRSCGSASAAAAVEAQVAAEIVTTYKTLKLRQQTSLIQNLNRLL